MRSRCASAPIKKAPPKPATTVPIKEVSCGMLLAYGARARRVKLCGAKNVTGDPSGGLCAHASARICQRDPAARAADQETLRLVAALAAQHLELLARLDPFRQDRDRQALAQRQHSAQNRRRLDIAFQLGGEEAVELDLVERKGAQRFERR